MIGNDTSVWDRSYETYFCTELDGKGYRQEEDSFQNNFSKVFRRLGRIRDI